MKEISVKDLNTEEKVDMVAGRTFWSFGGAERFDIPPVRVTDASNGIRQQYKDEGYTSRVGNIPAICYPALCALGCSFDEELAYDIGRALGKECRSRNISVLLGPGINIKRNPLCGRNFEYISEDPVLSGKMGAAFIRGVQSAGVAACPKHFAANNQETRRSKSDSVVDDRTLFELYLRSFEIAVKEGKPWAIMPAYNRLNGTYCCENKWLLEDVLRKEWGFDGVTISDWGAVNDIARSIENGLDVEMPGGVNSDKDTIKNAIEEMSISQTAVDRACQDILRLTKRTAEAANEDFGYDKKKHLDIAKKAAESSFVLLKNEGMLPLKKEEKLLVVGRFAKRPRYQGAGSSKVKLMHAETPWMSLRDEFESIKYLKGYDEDIKVSDECFNEVAEEAKTADKIIVFAGLPEEYESEGFDRKNMKLPAYQNIFIKRLSRINKNIIVIVQAGAPVEMLWRNEVQAVMMCYLSGSCFGSALAEVLTGRVSPSGRLAESFPHRMMDVPSYFIYPSDRKLAVYEERTDVGYRYYGYQNIKTAFPFGSGLSYTNFRYDEIQAKEADDKIEVSVTVSNIGEYDAKEVVQIYISGMSKGLFPVLAAFKKTEIKKGETKKIRLDIDPCQVAPFDENTGAFVLKAGTYTISAMKNAVEEEIGTEISIDSDHIYKVNVRLGNSKDPENFAYIKKEEKEITDNSSLRDLQKYSVMRPVSKLICAAGSRIETGIVISEQMPEMLMDSPFRQIPMGTNGKVKLKYIKKTCDFFNKIVNNKHRRK